MNRRELLFGGAGAAALGATDAAAATAAEPRFDPAAVEASLERIDRRMAIFSALDFSPRAAETPEEEELFASRNQVSRAAIRSLYFTGAFMEFAEHERAHPGVQERMARMQPEMDEAVNGMAGYLEAMTPEDQRNLQQEFKRDPELGMRIGEKLHSVAAEDGLGWGRRADLRLMVDDFSRRMKTQNPGLVMDPYVRKTRKVQANPGTDAEKERAFAVRAGEQAFWDFQQRSTKFVAAWDQEYSTRPRIDLAAIEENYPLRDDERPPDPTRGAKKVLSVGGYLLGAGLASAAAGGIFYLISTASLSLNGFVWGTVVLGGTIAPILIVGGLIVLLVGSIMYQARKP